MHGSLLSAASGKSEALLPDVPFPDDGEWFWVTVFVPLAAQGLTKVILGGRLLKP